MVVKILASLVFALLPIMAALRADVNVIDVMSVLYVGIGTLCLLRPRRTTGGRRWASAVCSAG